MAITVLLVAVVATVVDLASDDPVQSSAATTTLAPEAEETPLAEMQGVYTFSGAAPLASITDLQQAALQSLAPGIQVSSEVVDRASATAALCAGDSSVVNTVGLLTADEVAACETAGTEVVTLRRGVVAIAVFTSPENAAIDCVSLNDLYALLSAEADGFTDWGDANALTGTWGGAPLPSAPLEVFGPEAGSSRDALAQVVLARVARGDTGLDPAGRDFTTEIRSTAGTDPESVIAAVAASEAGLGWTYFTDAEEALDAGVVRPLRISAEDGGSCIGPNPETVEAAAYPASAHLYTHVDAAVRDGDEALQAWLALALDEDGLPAVEEAGYALLPGADLNRARTIWKTGITSQGQWGG